MCMAIGIDADVIISKDKSQRFVLLLTCHFWVEKKSSMIHSYWNNFYSNNWCCTIIRITIIEVIQFFPTIAGCFQIRSYPSLILPTATYTSCNIYTFTLHLHKSTSDIQGISMTSLYAHLKR